MKKSVFIIGMACISVSALSFSATLNSINKLEFQAAFVNKTAVSIATDNLNGQTIDNTFSMFLDDKGHIWGKMSQKPANELQTDQSVYSIQKDGTFYITWQHWDGAKQLCGRIFDTKNAYISVSCDHVFHTSFMKKSMKSGNHLE